MDSPTYGVELFFVLLVPFFFSYQSMKDNSLANIAGENSHNLFQFFTFVAYLPADYEYRKITRICISLMPVFSHRCRAQQHFEHSSAFTLANSSRLLLR